MMTARNRPFVFAATIMMSLSSAFTLADELPRNSADARRAIAAPGFGNRPGGGAPGDVIGPVGPVGPGPMDPGRPGFGGRPGRPGFPDRPRPGRGEVIFQPVNQYLVGDNILHVRQLLNLGPQVNGRGVEAVILRARTDFGRGQAQLLVNGMQAGYSQQVDTMTRDYFFQLDPFRNRLGLDIQTLQIQLQGRFTVEAVGVRLSRDMGGGFQNVATQVVRQQFQGQARIDLANLFPGRGYQQVRSVTIVASTEFGRGQAVVCSVNGSCSAPQTVGTNLASYVFPAYGNTTLAGSVLQLQGNFWIDSVTVEFDFQR